MMRFFQEYSNMMGFSGGYDILWDIMLLWSLAWKGVALWKAARNNDKYWYVALLVINTVGLLEIIYIFFFSNKKEKKNS
jgi:hypothetical protein